MSFEEIKATVLALPEGEQDLLVDSILAARGITPAQLDDLLKREAESEAHPEETEDGDVVMDRLFAKYCPSIPREKSRP